MVGREKNTHAPPGLSFSEWMVISEGIDANMGGWIKALAQYAKPEERRVLDALLDSGLLRTAEGKPGEYELRQDYDATVKAVLKEKRKEDMNWLAFSLGYLSVKAFRREDLEMAVDLLDQMKASGEVTRAEVGSLGWMLLGASMQDRIAEQNRKARQISRTQSRKMAERGDIAPEDAHLVKHVAKEGRFDLYYLQSVRNKEDVNSRHRLLCKYGKGTEWCTAKPGGDYHRYYAGVGIFILHIDGVPKYQFVDCGDAPERNEDEEQEDDIIQFMDVNDQPVDSLLPAEQKFLIKHADISCYRLAPEGFEDMAEFDSASDERVRGSSGSVAAKVLSMADDRAGAAAIRLGPALSRMSKSNVYWLTKSDSWGPRMADGILDALGGPLRAGIGKHYYDEHGTRPLMLAALSSIDDPANKIGPFADLVSPQDLKEMFRKGVKDGDRLLKSILENKKQVDPEDAQTIVSLASDVKGILEAMGKRIEPLFAGNQPRISSVYSKLEGRGDGSLEELSRFIEKNLADLPPEATRWAVLASSDREAAAKRILSAGLDDERTRIVFEIPEVAHLADDSHIRSITKSRSKTKGHWADIAGLANRHGKGKDDERLATVVRFLRNSDDLEGHEVVSTIVRANQDGQSDRLAELMPQEMIDMISLEDMKSLAGEAEESCRPSWASPNSKEREDCHKGRPLVALMKRTKLNFPMDYAIFMKKGRERDELMAKKIGRSDWKGSMTAMDLAEDKDLMAERVIEARGDKMAPGEIASVLAHSEDKKKFIKRLGGRIGSLAGRYESPYERHIPGLDDSEDWMDWLTSVRMSSEIIDDLLALYDKPLKAKSVYKLVSRSKDPKGAAHRLADTIRDMDEDSWERLKKMSLEDKGDQEEVMALLDDARHGGELKKGDTVVAERYPWAYATSIPDGEQKMFVGKRVHMPMRKEGHDSEKMRYKVVGTDGEDIMVSPADPFSSQTEGSYWVKVTPEWVFKSARKHFARP